MLDLYDEFAALIRALEDRGVDYAVCGGMAMAIWEHPRATVDIDILIESADLPTVVEIAEGLGYLFKARPMNFGAISIRRISKPDPEAGDVLILDMLLVTPQIIDVWETRTRVEWLQGTISVVSREGLIKLKSYRSSGTDLDDIRRLRGENEEA